MRHNDVVMPQLNKRLGKPTAGDCNPFVLFMKSKTVERGDAPIVVNSFAQFCQCAEICEI